MAKRPQRKIDWNWARRHRRGAMGIIIGTGLGASAALGLFVKNGDAALILIVAVVALCVVAASMVLDNNA